MESQRPQVSVLDQYRKNFEPIFSEICTKEHISGYDKITSIIMVDQNREITFCFGNPRLEPIVDPLQNIDEEIVMKLTTDPVFLLYFHV
jgi:hypothetical protein